MVHALVWLPVKMFTTSVMEAAADCWAWAIVGRPELELLVNKIYKILPIKQDICYVLRIVQMSIGCAAD